jgi:hypothetical protein
VERAGRQWTEVLRNGVRATAKQRGAGVLWGQFVETHPRMAMTYAQVLVEELKMPPASARGFFEIWWEKCASTRASDDEAVVYYRYAAKWSSPKQFEEWMSVNRKRLSLDYRTWTTLLHGWKLDARAWEIYRAAVPKPEAFTTPAGATRESLAQALRISPENDSAMLEYVHFLQKEGDVPEATRVLLNSASRTTAAPRVLREAAYALAAQEKYTDAVEMALREK